MNTIELAGMWSLSDLQEHTLSAHLPGDNYSALWEAGVIPDPYYGRNEDLVQWPRERTWVFSKEFDVDTELLQNKYVFLNLDSIDTLAEIRLNGKLIGTTENMFIRFRCEVKSLLKIGTNVLEIKIFPPGPEADKRAADLSFPLKWSINNQMPYQNLIRKVQCHSGWDWGITLVVCGIYGKMYLQGVDHASIDHVYTEQNHQNGKCILKVTAELTGDEEEIVFKFNGEVRKITASGTAETTFTVENPKLWFPLEYGDQELYTLTVSAGKSKITKKIGLRKVELIREKDEAGSSMYFKINDIPVFCKGADWIPVDAMPRRMTREVYQRLISDAAAVHMNMLRVWGGGLYEEEDFYEICDELGILVWQDCMFSCAEYPSEGKFMESVEQETEYQIKRLRDHASIVLWCGDNEIAEQLGGTGSLFYTQLANYDRFNQNLERAVRKADPTRMFWPSSPCNGPLECYGSWSDDTKGDLHYWDVWHGGKPFEAYYTVKPRFCSEFGYQAFPDISTVRKYGGKNVTDPIMEKHQKNNAGNMKILNMFSRYFPFPGGLENFVYLSQVQQALAIRTGVEFWRSLRPHCMGALYWQLNDNWPVASWSSIDYYGNWKLLHYAARRFFAPQLATARINEDKEAEFTIVNDALEEKSGLLRIEKMSFKGEILETRELQINVPAGSSVSAVKWPIPASEEYFLHYEWKDCKNDLFLMPYKSCSLGKADIRIQKVGNGFELETDVTAFFVSLEMEGVVWSDNMFTLLPDRPVTIYAVRGEIKGMPAIRQLSKVDEL
jgi:beta-mannosidase